MTERQKTKAGEPERAHHAGDGSPAVPRQRRMSAKRKQEAVLWALRGDDLELVSRQIGTTAADLSTWRDRFLEAGAVVSPVMVSLDGSAAARPRGLKRWRAGGGAGSHRRFFGMVVNRHPIGPPDWSAPLGLDR